MKPVETNSIPLPHVDSAWSTTPPTRRRTAKYTIGALANRAVAIWVAMIGGSGWLTELPRANAAAITFGEGPDSVFLVIEHPEFGPDPFLYEYRFTSPLYTEPVQGPSDFADLIRGDQLLEVLTDQSPIQAQGEQHNWEVYNVDFVDEFVLTIDAGDPISVFADPAASESWVQWAAGAFYSYTTWDTGEEVWGQHPAGTWSQGWGNPHTYLPPGASLGFTFGTYTYDADDDEWTLTAGAPSAIPEPVTGFLLIVGSGLMIAARKRSRSKG